MSKDPYLVDMAVAAGFSAVTNNATGEHHVVSTEDEFIIDEKIENFHKRVYSQCRYDTMYEIIAILSPLRKTSTDDMSKAIRQILEWESKERNKG